MTDNTDTDIRKNILSYYEELLAFVRGRGYVSSSAFDIVQETFLRFFSGVDKQTIDIRTVENPRAYLYRIAGNLVIDENRRSVTRARYMIDEKSSDGDEQNDDLIADRVVEGRQRLRFLAQAVGELPPRCQQVFRLRKVEQKSSREIADQLGISRNMVEKHLRRAIIYCRQRLEELEEQGLE
ncbi:sigma-70 family RNA polymerase sigma factor [Emcibacter sp.]|uniref:sigma-70 family RNA polymerase sigma factor n=1 Tax=Emcibacter sp. TaxID=1979954 RepID=UPI003A9515E5